MRLPIAFHNSEKYGVVIGEPAKLDKPFLFGTEEEYRCIISKVKEEYEELLRDGKKDLRSALDKFLKKISSYAILRYDFIRSLSRNLGISEAEIIRKLLSTDYIAKQLDYLKKNFRKKKKEKPLEYAECFGELVSLLGFDRAFALLKKNGIKVGKTTLNCFYKVSMMPSKVKKLIEDGGLPLTVAFELPEEELEEIAEKLVGLSFNEARKVLKEVKKRRKKIN